MTVCKGLLGECIDCIWPECEVNKKSPLWVDEQQKGSTVSAIDFSVWIGAYSLGYRLPRYPVPAIVECQWCGSRNDICDYNGDGCWCPSLCFILN